jgi:hypothetical protein
MVPTPTAPGMKHDEAQYRGFAMSCLRRLKDANKGLTIFHGTYQLSNGVEIFCNVCGNQEDVYVRVPTAKEAIVPEVIIIFTGIITHPRTGAITYGPAYYHDVVMREGYPLYQQVKVYGIVGGWGYGGAPITANSCYILSDADHASFVATNERYGFISGGMYGNLYWDNGLAGQARKSVSFKGLPTRHFRMGNYTSSESNGYDVEIPTLSEVESVYVSGTGDLFEDLYTPYWVPVGSKVYSGGKIFKEAPYFNWPFFFGRMQSKVLGATDRYLVTLNNYGGNHTGYAPEVLYQLSNGECFEGTFATANIAVNARLAALKNVRPAVYISFTWSPPNTALSYGFWTNRLSRDSAGKLLDGRYRSNEWELVLTVAGNRVSLPWFGSASGSKFVCSDGQTVEFTEQVDNTVAVYDYFADYTLGTYTETNGSGGTGNYVGDMITMITHAANHWFFEYKLDEIIFADVSFNFKAWTENGNAQKIVADHILAFGTVGIPLLKIRRNFILEWGHMKEDYEITKSTINYVDMRYGVCFYKTITEYIRFDKSSSELAYLKGPWNIMEHSQIKIKDGDFVAGRETKWHIVIDGVDTVLHTSYAGVDPWPDFLVAGGLSGITLNEFLVNGGYVGLDATLKPFDLDYVPEQGVRQVFLYPQPPSLGIPWSDDIRYFGFYDYGHNPYETDHSVLNKLDGGGKDYFFPEWIRMMMPASTVPTGYSTEAEGRNATIMQYVAERRWRINWYWFGFQEPSSWSFLTIENDPIPRGNFVRHPDLGDFWQFVVDNNGYPLAFQSNNLAAAGSVESKLNDWFEKNPYNSTGAYGSHTKITNHTAETTLYYPIGVI